MTWSWFSFLCGVGATVLVGTVLFWVWVRRIFWWPRRGDDLYFVGGRLVDEAPEM